jgi:hypothetical protein
VEVPLPWERLLWSDRKSPLFVRPWTRAPRYALTDFRLVLDDGERSDEVALQDIVEIRCSETWVDRLAGTSTIVVERRAGRRRAFTLRRVRRGQQLAALLELVAGEQHESLDAVAVGAVLSWEPRTAPRGVRRAIAIFAAAFVAIFAVAIKLSGTSAPIVYPADDRIAPGGEKKSREEIVRFMESDVMPWARRALAPIVGDAGQVTCLTCHGADAQARDWGMPSVAALPEPVFRGLAWEHSSVKIDAQLRNAIYGYSAESDNQTKATYMREFVLPGMAALLHRPAYDFSRSYDYNRSQFAIGCYHCHRVN